MPSSAERRPEQELRGLDDRGHGLRSMNALMFKKNMSPASAKRTTTSSTGTTPMNT
jgi:hypothetical protein